MTPCSVSITKPVTSTETNTPEAAKETLKSEYRFTKTYQVMRSQMSTLDAISINNDPKYDHIKGWNDLMNSPQVPGNAKRQSFGKGLAAALSQLQVTKTPALSGSTQVSRTISFAWETYENVKRRIAVMHYQDGGTGNDELTIAAQDKNTLAEVVSLFIDAGVLRDPADAKQSRNEKANARQTQMSSLGIQVGSTATLKTGYTVTVKSISPSGMLTVDMTGPDGYKATKVAKPLTFRGVKWTPPS